MVRKVVVAPCPGWLSDTLVHPFRVVVFRYVTISRRLITNLLRTSAELTEIECWLSCGSDIVRSFRDRPWLHGMLCAKQ